MWGRRYRVAPGPRPLPLPATPGSAPRRTTRATRRAGRSRRLVRKRPPPRSDPSPEIPQGEHQLVERPLGRGLGGAIRLPAPALVELLGAAELRGRGRPSPTGPLGLTEGS